MSRPLTLPLHESGSGYNENYLIQTAATYALGEIGSEDARKALRAKFDEGLNFKPYQERPYRELTTVCMALGRAGDESDIERLRKVYFSGKEFYTQALGYLPGIAMSMIRERKLDPEGRRPGVVQPEFLKLKKNFYVFDEYQRGARCTELYGARPQSQQLKYYAARRAGINGVISSTYDGNTPVFFNGMAVRTPLEMESKLSEFRSGMKSAADYGVKLFPGAGCEIATPDSMYWTLLLYGGYPGFGGYWNEEQPTYGGFGGMDFSTPFFVEKLKRRLAEKYSPVRRKELGLSDGELVPEVLKKLHDPAWIEKHRPMFVECLELQDELSLDACREGQEYVAQYRKNTPIMYDTTSGALSHGTMIATYQKLGGIVASHGTEPSYCAASYDNAFCVDLAGDGGRNHAGMEPYLSRCGTARNYELGMGIGILHAQRYMLYFRGRAYKQPGSDNEWLGRWKPDIWPMVTRVYNNMKKTDRYLIHAQMPHGIGLLYSGRTNCSPYGQGSLSDRTESRYMQNIKGTYELLKHTHAQFDLLSTETLDSERLREYSILVLPDARTLSDSEASLLEQWVRGGGVLISTGSTSIGDHWGRKLPNYRFAKLFGADYRSTRMVHPELWRWNLPRDIKDPRYIIKYTVFGTEVEYDSRAGYDVVVPTTGKTLGVWPDGSPAAVENDFGRGKSILLTAVAPALAARWNNMQSQFPLNRTFYPNVVPMMEKLILQAYRHAGVRVPVKTENVPEFTEILVKTQEGGARKIVHMLNYDNETPALVKDMRISVLWQGRAPSRVFLPVSGRTIPFEHKDGYISFAPGDLDVWNMAVIE